MKKQILLFSLLFYSLQMLSQQNDFSIRGSISNFINVENRSTNEFQSQSFTQIGEDMFIRQQINNSNERVQKHNSKLGFEILGIQSFQVKEKITIRIGLGINSTSFSTTNEFGNYTSEIVSTDTVMQNENTEFLNYCESYTNSFSDFSEMDQSTHHFNLSLKIPLEIEIPLLSPFLFLNAGGYLQTPIYTKISRESITTNRIDDVNKICEYQLNKIENTSGDTFNNLVLGVSTGLKYQLNNKFAINFGVTKDLSNQFVDLSANQQFPGLIRYQESIKPLRFLVGTTYKLNQKVTE